MTSLPTTSSARDNMDRMYRWQRHIYDLTRKPYLLGRDAIIAELKPAAGNRVLEIGCGTGRNLIAAARMWPQATFYGVDVSTEMLKAAQTAVARAGLTGRIKLAWADATNFDPQRTFAIADFDRIMFSYTLSMIPQWRAALDRSITIMAPQSSLLIADFGDQRELPDAFRTVLRAWLSWFHVTPRTDLEAVVRQTAVTNALACDFRPIYRGYAFLASLQRVPA